MRIIVALLLFCLLALAVAAPKKRKDPVISEEEEEALISEEEEITTTRKAKKPRISTPLPDEESAELVEVTTKKPKTKKITTVAPLEEEKEIIRTTAKEAKKTKTITSKSVQEKEAKKVTKKAVKKIEEDKKKKPIAKKDMPKKKAPKQSFRKVKPEPKSEEEFVKREDKQLPVKNLEEATELEMPKNKRHEKKKAEETNEEPLTDQKKVQEKKKRQEKKTISKAKEDTTMKKSEGTTKREEEINMEKAKPKKSDSPDNKNWKNAAQLQVGAFIMLNGRPTKITKVIINKFDVFLEGEDLFRGIKHSDLIKKDQKMELLNRFLKDYKLVSVKDSIATIMSMDGKETKKGIPFANERVLKRVRDLQKTEQDLVITMLSLSDEFREENNLFVV